MVPLVLIGCSAEAGSNIELRGNSRKPCVFLLHPFIRIITSYRYEKAMCIYILIRRLNNIFVDYMFHYKYVLRLLILGGKEHAKTHTILSPLDHEQLQPFLVYYIIQYICLSMLNYHLSLSVLGYPE